MDIREIFATNLRNRLYAKNRKNADLARFCGVSQTSVSHWINGMILPRPKMIDKIALYLGCTSDDLMTDNSKTVQLMPEDILAQEIKDRPLLFQLMFYASKLSDSELQDLIKGLKK